VEGLIMNTRIYRDPPAVNLVEPAPRKSSRLVVAISGVALWVMSAVLEPSWDRVSDRMLVVVIAVIGIGVVTGIKYVHAAWKKRHDAKLMIEWERRLEEKG
jgi:phosphatidylglycerophosphate synthase